MLTRWEPFREMLTMREALNRMFDDPFRRSATALEGWDIPLMDLYETDSEVVIKASLPGIRSDNIDISITGDMLTIRGSLQEEEEVKGATYHLRERRVGSTVRSLTLPAPVDANKASAEFEDGILTLTLPKREEAQPKVIHVKTK